MREIFTHDYIRLLYVYENPSRLAIKYYIQSDFYLSVWNKENDTSINAKASDIQDDLGFGGTFPLPQGVDGNCFIGLLYPEQFTETATHSRLKGIQTGEGEEGNPILVFYEFNEP